MRLICSKSSEIFIAELWQRLRVLAVTDPAEAISGDPQLARQVLGCGRSPEETLSITVWKQLLNEFFYSKVVGKHKVLHGLFPLWSESEPEQFRVGTHVIESVLGIGSSACSYRTADGYCLKVAGISSKRKMENEYNILRQIGHKNIVRCFEFICGSDYVAIKQELLLPELGGSSAYIAGLKYCHEHGFLHGDIRLNNLGIDACGTGKLFDFGSARRSVAGCEMQNELDLLEKVLKSPIAEGRKRTHSPGVGL